MRFGPALKRLEGMDAVLLRETAETLTSEDVDSCFGTAWHPSLEIVGREARLTAGYNAPG